MSKWAVRLLITLLSTGVLAGAWGADLTVEVVMHGTTLKLSPESSRQLAKQVVDLVKTSNFHWRIVRAGLGEGVEVEKELYRKVRMGDRLSITLPEQSITTVGGDVRVTGIVIGLGREDRAEWLFTLDGEDVPVVHSMFSGIECVRLLESIRRMSVTSPETAGR